MLRLSFCGPALVAQRIEHLTTDQKVGGSSPSERAKPEKNFTTSRVLPFLEGRCVGVECRLATEVNIQNLAANREVTLLH